MTKQVRHPVAISPNHTRSYKTLPIARHDQSTPTMSPVAIFNGEPSTTTNGEPSNANGLNGLKTKHHIDGFGTRAIHVGSEPDPATGAVIPPISLSTTYKQDGVGNHKVSEMDTW